jgi:SAM-dependent methyltransferase
VDAQTEELRAAHDVLSEFYAERLAGALDRMPQDRAVLGLFCELVLRADIGTNVGDIGCGTGRLDPFLAVCGLSPTGIDLSPEMIRVARREQPGFEYEVADLRELPFPDASLAGLVCWYSLMYLPPSDRPAAFAELARVVKPGGYLVTAFKAGDGSLRRGGRTTGLGVEFDIYWLSPDEMERRVNDAGFATVFWGGIPPEKEGSSTGGYLIARRPGGEETVIDARFQDLIERIQSVKFGTTWLSSGYDEEVVDNLLYWIVAMLRESTLPDPEGLRRVQLTTRRPLRPGYVRQDVDSLLQEIAEACASL